MKLFVVAILLHNVLGVINIPILRNESHIYCPSQEYTPYLIPSVNEVKNFGSSLTNTAVLTSDWYTTKSPRSVIGPVLDKRWSGFNFTQDKLITLQSFRAMSLSLLSPFNIRVFSNERNYTNSKETDISSNSNEWIHYTFVSENHSLHLYENGKLLRAWTLIDEQITNVVIKSDKDLYWKLHEYEYKSANTVTEGEPTTLLVPQDASCLTIYTILCTTCYLEVFLNEHSTLNITSNDNFNVLKTWQSHTLKVYFKTQNIIKLYRGKTDNNNDGFWDLDVTFCHPDFALYKVNGSTENYTCHDLNANVNGIGNENFTFCEKPGKFGRNCERSCSEILGLNYSYCEDHEMCDEHTCVCPWGYTGNDCKEGCKEGTWGLHCKHNCTKCENCDKKTGQCVSQHVPEWAQIATIRVIVICVLIITIFSLYTLYRKIILYYMYAIVNAVPNPNV